MKANRALYNPLAVVALFVTIMSFPVFAGGLDRVMVTGPTGVGNGSDPDGPWILENLGSRIQIRGEQLELGAEIMMPKFTLKKRSGRTLESESIAHILPYLNYGVARGDGQTVGLEIATEYGIGASIRKSYGSMDTYSLVSGIYVKPFVAQRLSDRWSLGLSVMLVNASLEWRGPLDINRRYLPIYADTKATGWGGGFGVGLFYQPAENFALGLNYMSKVETDLFGRTEISRFFRFRDQIKTRFEFPDRLTLSAAWQPAERWLVVADCNYYGYSRNSLDAVSIKFDKLMITKSVTTDWVDNIVVHFGVSWKASQRLTVGGGFGYMSKAIPDATSDFMTPDVAGVGAAGRVKYEVTDSFDLTVGVSRGWGSNKARGTEVTADIWTVAISGGWKF
ncbi:MAG: outer membrane protein transport protein [Patescibacteria group bacterium]